MNLLILMVFVLVVCVIHTLICNVVARLKVLNTWMLYIFILWISIPGASLLIWFKDGWLESIGLDVDNYFILVFWFFGLFGFSSYLGGNQNNPNNQITLVFLVIRVMIS